ncbi:MAG: AAA family ATPase [Planctomycetaceae bacterium]|jgi:predicted ATP-binding protein involved in virulence|nr:AAA family ATPase [Planctomycetaceae bacterium]
MRIKELLVENFRGIRRMELELHPKLNVFIGVNGSGKSSVLDIIAMLFSRSPIFSDGNSIPITAQDISKKADTISAELFCVADLEYSMQLSYSKTSQSSHCLPLHGNGSLENLRRDIQDGLGDCCFPLVVYYPANRAVLDIPERIRGFRSTVNPLNALDGALTNSLDYHLFFGRLRESEHSVLKKTDLLSKMDTDPFLKWYILQIDTIKNALNNVFSEQFSSLQIQPQTFNFTIAKHGDLLTFSQFSDGEKGLIALVGDLAQRLAIANPPLENPLEGEGIVLIDEIDLHLHPQWQRMILPKLTETFPNCQFIVSTHSPQVLGEIRSENVFILIDGETGIEYHRPSYEIFGQTSDILLEDMMQTSDRNIAVQKDVEQILLAIERGNPDDAKILYQKLKERAKDISECSLIDLRLGTRRE